MALPPQHPSGGRVGAVVVAAGGSTRMGGADKTFAPILGLPLVAHSLRQLEEFPLVSDVALVLAGDSVETGRTMVREHGFQKVIKVCAGGRQRQDSVRIGLESLPVCDWVMVHDGARPCLDQAMMERGLQTARECGAAVAGVPVKDTIKMVTPEKRVLETPARERLWAAQTPQIFRYDLLLEAHRLCTQPVTDDAAMVEAMGHPVQMFIGSYENIKVTTPEDLPVVEAFLRRRSQA